MTTIKLLHYPKDHEALAKVIAKSELTTALVANPPDAVVEGTVQAALKYGFPVIQSTSYLAPTFAEKLKGSNTSITCCVGMMCGLEGVFSQRAYVIDLLRESGVVDFDIGIEQGLIDAADYAAISKNIEKEGELIHRNGGQLGITLEIAMLSDAQKIDLTRLAIDAGADFLRICGGLEKISGVDGGRASLYEICLLKDRFGDQIKIKAGGGWDYNYAEDMLEYINSGADRVDAGPAFVEQLKALHYEEV